MSNMASAGKIGTMQYLIISNEADCTAVIISRTGTYEITMPCWNSASKWIERTIKKIEVDRNEVERDY